MANAGLFRLVFFVLVVLVLCGSLARADQPDALFSRAWIHSQKFKRAEEVVQLTHLVQKSKISDPDVELVDIVNGTGSQTGKGFFPGNPDINGGVILTGPASRLHDMYQVTSPWKIVGCAATRKNKYNVLAYCVSPDPKNCSGIFVGGAKHTIVKLPDGCGVSPFARVVKFEHTRQKLPKSEIQLIGDKKVSVFELVFDYDFKSIPYREGEATVQLHVEFSNLAGYIENPDFGKPRSYEKWLSNVDTLVSQKHQARFRENDLAQNSTNIPFGQNFSATLASLSAQCDGFDMSLSIGAEGTVNGSINFGYYVTGSAIPSNISDHYVYLTAEADVETTLNLEGMASYTFNGLSVPVVPSVGLPGLSYPGLLTLGPYWELNIALSGDIELDGIMNATSGFSVPIVDISIGNSSTPQSNSQGTNFGNVTLSNSIRLSTGITVSLVPQIGVQINALSGVVDADVSLQPSAGVTSTVSDNLTGQQNPCVELDGEVDLNWQVGGNVGTWGASTTGKIWGIQKKLWSKCLNDNSTTQGLASDTEWKQVFNDDQTPLRSANSFDSMACPSSNPFKSGNSTTQP